jgi:hypothetical protein
MAGDDEMTKKEKETADKIDEKTADDKSKIDELSEGMNTLLKSQVEEKKEEEDQKAEEKGFDLNAVSVEDLAKSIMEKDDPKKTIKEICDACNVHPRDMIDEDGEPFIDEEMMKSLEKSKEVGERYMYGVLASLDEMNFRNAKKDEVNLQFMQIMAKSLSEIGEKVQKLEKGMKNGEYSMKSTEGAKFADDQGLPDVGDGAANAPLSQQEDVSGGTKKGFDEDAYKRALKKSFPGTYGNEEERKKFYQYEELLKSLNPEDFLNAITNHTDRKLIEYNLSFS